MWNYCALIFFMTASNLWGTDLVVGTTSAYAPFVSLDDEGAYSGFDIDIAEELARKLNRTLVIKDLGSMPSLLLGIKQNRVDALIWALSITEERQKQMEMVYYQGKGETTLPLLFWKQIPEGVHSIEDLIDKPACVISVEAGSFQENFLQSIPGLTLKQVDKVTDALLELKYGKTIATMVDPSLVEGILKKYPQIQVMHVPLPATLQAFGNGIGINKNNKSLISEVQQAINEMQRSGKIIELEKKWNLTGK